MESSLVKPLKQHPSFYLIRSGLTVEERKKFRMLAKQESRTMSGLATYLIRQHIKQQEAQS